MIIRVELSVTMKVRDHYLKQTGALEMTDAEAQSILDFGRPQNIEDVQTIYTRMSDVLADSVWAGLESNLEGLE